MVQSLEEKVQIVNDQDKPIGGAVKVDIWKKGLRHRIVRIIVKDKHDKILLQKRSSQMALWPGAWDNSASGHVGENEPYEIAAKRELKEELGISNVPLKEVAYYSTEGKFEWRILKRFVKVYETVIEDSIAAKPEQGEVSGVKWFTVKEIKDLLEKENVSDGLIEIYDRCLK